MSLEEAHYNREYLYKYLKAERKISTIFRKRTKVKVSEAFVTNQTEIKIA